VSTIFERTTFVKSRKTTNEAQTIGDWDKKNKGQLPVDPRYFTTKIINLIMQQMSIRQ